jgi:hypothetical protein
VPILALRPRPDRAPAQLAAIVLGLAVLLTGPAAYAASTMTTAYGGGDPSAGPAIAGPRGGFGGGAPAFVGGGRAFAGGGPAIGGGAGVGGQGFAGGQRLGGSLDGATLDYLVANRGTARWIVAVGGANAAGQIELDTRQPVMAMGGFSGGDDAPTLAQLQALVADGSLRFVAPEGGGPGGRSSGIAEWVQSACTPVTVNGTATAAYDCAGASAG